MNRYRSGMGADDLGWETELVEALAVLDPAQGDPNYWIRFRAWVMGAAARDLARRRMLAQLTVGDVMRSWARTLVPAAVATALLAGLLLVRSHASSTPLPVGVEELLVTEIVDGETIPMMLEAEEEATVAFAAEIF